VESIAAEQPSAEQTELENLEQLFSEEMGTVATSSDDLPIGMETIIPNDGFLIEPSKPIASHNAATRNAAPHNSNNKSNINSMINSSPRSNRYSNNNIVSSRHRRNRCLSGFPTGRVK
jgi:hypothetical protein